MFISVKKSPGESVSSKAEWVSSALSTLKDEVKSPGWAIGKGREWVWIEVMYGLGYIIIVTAVAVTHVGVEIGNEIFRILYLYVAGRGSWDCIGIKMKEYLREYSSVSIYIGGLCVGVSVRDFQREKVA